MDKQKDERPMIETVTPEQAAEIMHMTSRTVYTYLRAGTLKGRKVGGRKWLILREDLEAFIRGDDSEH